MVASPKSKAALWRLRWAINAKNQTHKEFDMPGKKKGKGKGGRTY